MRTFPIDHFASLSLTLYPLQTIFSCRSVWLSSIHFRVCVFFWLVFIRRFFFYFLLRRLHFVFCSGHRCQHWRWLDVDVNAIAKHCRYFAMSFLCRLTVDVDGVDDCDEFVNRINTLLLAIFHTHNSVLKY